MLLRPPKVNFYEHLLLQCSLGVSPILAPHFEALPRRRSGLLELLLALERLISRVEWRSRFQQSKGMDLSSNAGLRLSRHISSDITRSRAGCLFACCLIPAKFWGGFQKRQVNRWAESVKVSKITSPPGSPQMTQRHATFYTRYTR